MPCSEQLTRACLNSQISHVAAKVHHSSELLACSVYKNLQSDHYLGMQAPRVKVFLCLLQVPALYIIFARPSTTIADSIFYQPYQTQTLSSSQLPKKFTNLYLDSEPLYPHYFYLFGIQKWSQSTRKASYQWRACCAYCCSIQNAF